MAINTTDNNLLFEYDFVNSPGHYNAYSLEVIDMMVKIWGVEKTVVFCEMNAYKYRMRMGNKPGDEIQQDIEKERWYLNKANELKRLHHNTREAKLCDCQKKIHKDWEGAEILCSICGNLRQYENGC